MLVREKATLAPSHPIPSHPIPIPSLSHPFSFHPLLSSPFPDLAEEEARGHVGLTLACDDDAPARRGRQRGGEYA